MRTITHALRTSRFALCMLGACLAPAVWGQAGTEQYRYDALGRLIQVTRTNGQANGYQYDAAGNRQAAGPVAGGAPGTITYVNAKYPSGCGGCTGEFWIDVRNSGSGPLSGVTFTLVNVGVAGCSPSGGPSSIPAGQTVRYTWFKPSGATVRCRPRITASNATNSPVTWDL